MDTSNPFHGTAQCDVIYCNISHNTDILKKTLKKPLHNFLARYTSAWLHLSAVHEKLWKPLADSPEICPFVNKVRKVSTAGDSAGGKFAWAWNLTNMKVLVWILKLLTNNNIRQSSKLKTWNVKINGFILGLYTVVSFILRNTFFPPLSNPWWTWLLRRLKALSFMFAGTEFKYIIRQWPHRFRVHLRSFLEFKSEAMSLRCRGKFFPAGYSSSISHCWLNLSSFSAKITTWSLS